MNGAGLQVGQDNLVKCALDKQTFGDRWKRYILLDPIPMDEIRMKMTITKPQSLTLNADRSHYYEYCQLYYYCDLRRLCLFMDRIFPSLEYT